MIVGYGRDFARYRVAQRFFYCRDAFGGKETVDGNLLFAQRAAKKYGISSRDVLVEMGRRKTVGGQQDMIEDVALDMARAKA